MISSHAENILALGLVLLVGLFTAYVASRISKRTPEAPVIPRRESTPVDLAASFDKFKTDVLSKTQDAIHVTSPSGREVYVNGCKVWTLPEVKTLCKESYCQGRLDVDRSRPRKTYEEWEKENLP